MSCISLRALCCLLAFPLLAAGCIVDRSGTSGSYLLRTRVESLQVRGQNLERDLHAERVRIDTMTERATEARRRYADSGATVQALMEDLNSLRGEIASLHDYIAQSENVDADVDYRLTDIEGRVLHMEAQLVEKLARYEAAPLMPLPVPSPPDVAAEPQVAGVAPTGQGGSVAGVTTDGAEPDGGSSDGVLSEGGGEEVSRDEQDFKAAFAHFDSGSWKKAGQRLQRFLQSHPHSSRYLEAQYLIGRCLAELGRHKGAITEFQKVVVAAEDSAWAPRAMYMQALSFMALGTQEDQEAAEIFFSELIRLYPSAPEAKQARTHLESLDG